MLSGTTLPIIQLPVHSTLLFPTHSTLPASLVLCHGWYSGTELRYQVARRPTGYSPRPSLLRFSDAHQY
eukprot:3391289-Rhodomonas_salina.1